MTGNEYQKSAMRTNDGQATLRLYNAVHAFSMCDVSLSKIDIGGIFNAALGLSGEVGELNDMIKKWIYHEKDLDLEHAKKELGDVMWYVAMMCHSFGWELDEILQMNVDKLKARYPEGFDVELAKGLEIGSVEDEDGFEVAIVEA